MNTALAEPESAVRATSPRSDAPRVESRPTGARHSIADTLPVIDPHEYKLLYLPTMVAVYTARHQQMPTSDEQLRRHVFGFGSHSGCEACREETEFLVAHQKGFFK
jgi:hypothetical protein